MKELAPDRLLEVCGTAGPLEILVEGPGESSGRRVVLTKPFALVGRAKPADIFLDHPEVGARHLYLQILDGRAFGVDLGSRRGTLWAGVGKALSWIDAGTSIGVGPYTLQLGQPASSAVGTADSPLTPANLPGVRLAILRDGQQQSSWLMDRRLALVGRSDVCQVRLIDASVSRVHCSLVWSSAGLLVIDLGGRGGVVVNGQPIRAGLLEEDDEVHIGAYVLRVAKGSDVSAEDTHVTGLAGMLAPSQAVPPARVSPAGVLPSGFTGEALAGRLSEDSVIGLLLLRLMDQFGRMQQQMYENFQQTLMTTLQLAGRPAGGTPEPRPDSPDIQHVLAELQQLRGELKDRNGTHDKPGRDRPSPEGQPAEPEKAPLTAARQAPPPTVQDPGQLHAALCDQLRKLEEDGRSRWRKLLDMITGGQ